VRVSSSRATTVMRAVSRNSESWAQVLGLVASDSWFGGVRCDVVRKWIWVGAYLTLLVLMSLSRATMVMHTVSRNSES
jgi:hypothetical protein